MKIHIPLPLGLAAANRLTRTVISVINTADPNLTPNFTGELDVEEYLLRHTDVPTALRDGWLARGARGRPRIFRSHHALNI